MTDLTAIIDLVSDISLAGILLWLLVTDRRRADNTIRRYELRHDRIVEYLVQTITRNHSDDNQTRPIVRPDEWKDLRDEYWDGQ